MAADPSSSDLETHRLRRVPARALRLLAISLPLLLVALLAYGVIAQSPDTTIDDSLARGRTAAAPAFDLAVLQAGALGLVLQRELRGALAGGQISLTELKGIPVVLNFWASWCVPCAQEASTLERAWQHVARPHRVLFVGLDMQDVTGDAHDFLRHFRIDYLNIRDPTDAVSRSYGATGVPETFFISPTGQIVGHIIGASSTAQLQEGIAAAQSGRITRAVQGGPQGAIR